MKIYLSSSFEQRSKPQAFVKYLRILDNVDVVSGWHSRGNAVGDRAKYGGWEKHEHGKHALLDLQDIANCDALVQWTEGKEQTTRGGRHIEFGVALALQKHIILIGPRENPFHHLKVNDNHHSDRIIEVDDEAAALQEIKKLAETDATRQSIPAPFILNLSY